MTWGLAPQPRPGQPVYMRRGLVAEQLGEERDSLRSRLAAYTPTRPSRATFASPAAGNAWRGGAAAAGRSASHHNPAWPGPGRRSGALYKLYKRSGRSRWSCYRSRHRRNFGILSPYINVNKDRWGTFRFSPRLARTPVAVPGCDPAATVTSTAAELHRAGIGHRLGFHTEVPHRLRNGCVQRADLVVRAPWPRRCRCCCWRSTAALPVAAALSIARGIAQATASQAWADAMVAYMVLVEQVMQRFDRAG